MAIDLSGAKDIVESLTMDDACAIFPSSNVADYVLDEETGQLVPGDNADALYEGKFGIRPVGVQDAGIVEEAGVEISDRIYLGRLPLDETSAIPRGALLVVTQVKRDPQLLGKEFTVKGSVYGTLAITRRLVLELRF